MSVPFCNIYDSSRELASSQLTAQLDVPPTGLPVFLVDDVDLSLDKSWF